MFEFWLWWAECSDRVIKIKTCGFNANQALYQNFKNKTVTKTTKSLFFKKKDKLVILRYPVRKDTVIRRKFYDFKVTATPRTCLSSAYMPI